MRYGTLPIVCATGGLVDTVTTYDEARGTGTGFVFHDLRSNSLADTIGCAVAIWYDRPAHVALMRRPAMAEDHCWERAARAYVELYLAAYARRHGHAFGAAAEHRTVSAAKRATVRAAVDRPFERLPRAVRHARAPVRLRA